jgi:hypothetical protein
MVRRPAGFSHQVPLAVAEQPFAAHPVLQGERRQSGFYRPEHSHIAWRPLGLQILAHFRVNQLLTNQDEIVLKVEVTFPTERKRFTGTRVPESPRVILTMT